MNILERDPVKVKIGDVKEDVANPNKLNESQMNGLRESMKRFGFLHPLAIDSIADRWHRLLVYKEFNHKFIPAYKIKFKDDAERRLFRQTMNKLRGKHDKDLDAQEMRILFENDRLDVLSTLIAKDNESIAQFLEKKFDDIEFDKPEEVFDIEIDREAAPISKLGNIWQLGNHRLLCGDATDNELLDYLMERRKQTWHSQIHLMQYLERLQV